MQRLILIIFISIISFYTKAAVFNVTVSNFSFTPNNIPNVLVGDVVTFTWTSGNHTTTCDPAVSGITSLPGGAATWNQVINSTNTTFSYTVTQPGDYNYVCIPHQPNMKGVFTASNPLPVILTSFKVTNMESKAILNWKTSSEENSDFFSVQKSTTGKEYKQIGQIPAAGNSSVERSYSFVDNTPVDNNQTFVYYMIGIVDKDGKKNYSSTEIFKSRQAGNKMILAMTPNPVSKGGHLMVDFNADSPGKMQVQLYNSEGKVVIKTILDAQRGVNMAHIHVGDLPAGTYSINFSMKEKNESDIIVIK